MAVVAKHGVWDNSVYPWTDQTADGVIGSIVTEIDAWISAISSNPSIVANGMVPVKLKGPEDTDGGGTNGFVYEFPDTTIGLNKDGPTWPTLMLYGSDTNVTLAMTDEYTDSSSNGGLGSAGQTPGHRSVTSNTATAGFNNEVIICTETTDGEEFLAVGIRLGTSNTYVTNFLVARDQDDHWLFTVKSMGFAYDSIMGFWTGASGPYDNDPGTSNYASTNAYRPFLMGCTSPSGASNRPGYNGTGQGMWTPKSEKVWLAKGSSAVFGEFVPIPGTTEQVMDLGNSGPAIIIPA